MAESRPTLVDTPEGIWLPPAEPIAKRWGCILSVAALCLIPGIVLIASGRIIGGVIAVALLLLLTLVLMGTPAPSGVTITAYGVRAEQRSGFRREGFEISRSSCIELWVDELRQIKEREAKLYLFALSPDRQTKYAIRLFSSSHEEIEEAAKRVARVLRVPRIPAWIPPVSLNVNGSFRTFAADGMARYQRMKALMGKAAVVDSGTDDLAAATRDLRRSMGILAGYGARVTPEAWLVFPDRSTITHQLDGGARTDHGLDEVADIEILPEKLGEAVGDDSPKYIYTYSIYLVLTSGERFLVRRCGSTEESVTERSQGLLDAEWNVQYLRDLVGLA